MNRLLLRILKTKACQLDDGEDVRWQVLLQPSPENLLQLWARRCENRLKAPRQAQIELTRLWQWAALVSRQADGNLSACLRELPLTLPVGTLWRVRDEHEQQAAEVGIVDSWW